MPTTDFFGLLEVVSGDTTGLVSKFNNLADTFDAVGEGLVRAISKDGEGNGIITGLALSDEGGLHVHIATGKFFASGIYCVQAEITGLNIPAEITAHVYAVADVSPNTAKTCTFQAIESATPPARGIEIATVITTADDITSIDNASAGRPKLAWEA